ncbi:MULTISPECIES: DUF6953 family protein [Acetobacter]|uniref:DUF6953 family protein n=1 Tax=Acetobacter TaxID=434 RepID=UPI0039E8005F
MTPLEAAQWMFNELQRDGYLDQETAAWKLLQQDKTFVYTNANGNLGIDAKVLKAFNKLAPTSGYVWSRSERSWRRRGNYDVPGKRMQD